MNKDICALFEYYFHGKLGSLTYAKGFNLLKLTCHYAESGKIEEHMKDFVKFFYETKEYYQDKYKVCLDMFNDETCKKEENFLERISHNKKLKKYKKLLLKFDKFKDDFEQTFLIKIDEVYKFILDYQQSDGLGITVADLMGE